MVAPGGYLHTQTSDTQYFAGLESDKDESAAAESINMELGRSGNNQARDSRESIKVEDGEEDDTNREWILAMTSPQYPCAEVGAPFRTASTSAANGWMCRVR